MKIRKNKLATLWISALCLLCTGTVLVYGDISATGRQWNLENWIMVEGGPLTSGSLTFNIQRASYGQPFSGTTLSNPVIINEIPTYDNRLFTGFLFVNFFDYYFPDDQYDIEELRAFKYENGPEISPITWTNDQDPYFTWKHKSEDLPVEGYSVEFDALPDKFVNTVTPTYQTPDFFLNEGPHTFYVMAKNTDGNFGGVGSFELWVDKTEPVISDILPLDSSVINQSQPTIQATIFDALSGVDLDAITLQITTETETYQVLGTYDVDTGVLSYRPPEPLLDGLVTIQLSAQDEAGNAAVPLFWTFTIDTSSPTGTLLINNGAASTDSNIVTLQITAVELETALDKMMLSNDGLFDNETWEPYSATKENWFLNPVGGIKTVYIKFRDVAGNESEVFKDSILLTVASPNTFIVTAPPSITQLPDASFSFTSTEPGSLFSYRLDNAEWTPLDAVNQVTFSDLSGGNHYFQVRSGFDLDGSGTIDPDEIDTSPAIVSWTIGSLNPSTLFAERPVKYYRRE